MLLIRLLALRKLCQSKLLNWLPWSEWIITSCLGLRRHTAISNASMAKSLHIRGFIDQPITWRENRSSTTAKYNQPSYVRM
ncbi:hypothetical protein D9M70_564420 [compost metagenome]